MQKGELIIGMVWMGFGIFTAIGGYVLKLGSLNKPGPGMLPFVGGIILLLCSVPILIGSVKTTRTERANDDIWQGVNLAKIGVVVGSVLGYSLILEKIGFVLTTFIVFIFIFKTADSRKWRTILILSFLSTFVSYLIFHILLQVQLPVDPWRIF